MSQVIACVHPFKQGVSWMMFVLKDALCSPSTALDVYSVQRGEVGADNPLCSFYDPLQ